MTPAMSLDRLVAGYPGRGPVLHGVNLALPQGQVLGIVGESGSGKSTLARVVAGLLPWQSGQLQLMGQSLRSGQAMPAALRRRVQMVFQNPFASLDPRMNVRQSLEEPLRVHEPRMDGPARRAHITRAVEQVGLEPAVLEGYPGQLSGGQCQRIAIARALVLEPALLICDEAVSALDVSVQAQVLNLLMQRQRDMGLAMLFISHDMAVVRHLSDRIAVMYRGRIVEAGEAGQLCSRPAHPYTRDLLQALAGVPAGSPAPALAEAGVGGCVYAPRCPLADGPCRSELPAERLSGGRRVACHHPLGVAGGQPD